MKDSPQVIQIGDFMVVKLAQGTFYVKVLELTIPPPYLNFYSKLLDVKELAKEKVLEGLCSQTIDEFSYN